MHELFFKNMGVPIPTEPDINLAKQISKDFGNYNKFKSQFTAAAIAVEASRMVYISLDT